jgi:hypothetical protein
MPGLRSRAARSASSSRRLGRRALRGLTINGDDTSSRWSVLGQGLQLTIEDCEINVGGSGICAIATGGTVRVKETVLEQSAKRLSRQRHDRRRARSVHAYHNYPSGVGAYGAPASQCRTVLAHSVAGVHAVSNFGVTSVTVTRAL